MPRKTTSSRKTRGHARTHIKHVAAPTEVTSTQPEKKSSILDVLKFGESYTSLILGIIVVIVATILLLSFVKTRNGNKQPTNPAISQQLTQEQAQQVQYNISDTPSVLSTIVVTPTLILTPTTQPTAKPTTKPTAVPTKVVARVTKTIATPTVTKVPTAVPTKKVEQKQIAQKQQPSNKSTKTYTVVAGDSLWSIAEKEYKSGYNWIDIARVNNLSNPSEIHSGNKLIIPVVTSEIATVTNTPTPTPKVVAQKPTTSVTQNNNNSSINMNKITGATYTVQKGDSLWSIAVRAYGDGYQWTKIAQANGLTDPGLIFSGNVLKIPRN
jgi:nucleoid-associated protein YgaU